MDLYQQVCTLEQAKRLKELGIEGRALFYFYEERIMYYTKRLLHGGASSFVPRWTVAELGEMLGDFVECINLTPARLWRAAYEHRTIDKRERNFGTGTTMYETSHELESDARAAKQ